ncbi:glycosyltransferase [Pseudoduganella sp. GCM10020061]|uniref:glycosyltransferase n=1 Tax=Pseudoduganella sp. GCM10020061 TaxID=3317345 RepID=UPI0036305FB3
MAAQFKEITDLSERLSQYPALPPSVVRELPPEPEQATGVPVRVKFAIAVACAFGWTGVSLWLATKWMADLSALIGQPLTYALMFAILVVPGMANAFIVASLAMDRRPPRRRYATLPGVTILVAAYNEEASILSTLASINEQDYPGPVDVIVINDGSRDRTMALLESVSYPWLRVLDLKKNGGKARALNEGLKLARHQLTITIDGDSCLYKDALRNLVSRYVQSSSDTAAVAGSVMVRNSRQNAVAKVQDWDYFHGMAAVKRIQSMYEGTLVAQGAFSLYRTSVLREVGGWPESVGEDIVVSWAILQRGYKVGYCEHAVLFTNAPDTMGQFIRQRERWSRGLIEAFKSHWRLLFKKRLSTVFIWYNLFVPYVDLVYTLTFVPGIALALAGYFWLAGPMTLLLLPLAMLFNLQIFMIQSRMFDTQGLKVRRNLAGFLGYALLYGAVMQPACLVGYFKEIFRTKKTWGTK